MTPKYRGHGGPPRRGTRGGGPVRRTELLVFTEGLRTEVQYLNHWHRLYRERVIVTIAEEHGAPLTLVKLAIETREHERNEERRKRGKARDEYWCVFDRDEHPHFDEAVELAEREGIRLAVTNPCIELWFLWHFDDCTAHMERHDVQRRAQALLKCDKNLSKGALQLLGDEARYADASKRAQGMAAQHLRNGSPAGSNPSSSMAPLIDRIRSGIPDA